MIRRKTVRSKQKDGEKEDEKGKVRSPKCLEVSKCRQLEVRYTL